MGVARLLTGIPLSSMGAALTVSMLFIKERLFKVMIS
jgi:hypothetical protein